MLILGTLIVTWIVHNWWKILLLIVAVIVVHEYVVHKKHGEYPSAEQRAAKDVKEGGEPGSQEADGEPAQESDTGSGEEEPAEEIS